MAAMTLPYIRMCMYVGIHTHMHVRQHSRITCTKSTTRQIKRHWKIRRTCQLGCENQYTTSSWISYAVWSACFFFLVKMPQYIQASCTLTELERNFVICTLDLRVACAAWDSDKLEWILLLKHVTLMSRSMLGKNKSIHMLQVIPMWKLCLFSMQTQDWGVKKSHMERRPDLLLLVPCAPSKPLLGNPAKTNFKSSSCADVMIWPSCHLVLVRLVHKSLVQVSGSCEYWCIHQAWQATSQHVRSSDYLSHQHSGPRAHLK